MSEPNQHLDDWVAEMHREIDRFREYWLNNLVRHGDEMYPAEMWPGEWDEQFRAFTELEERDDGREDD